MKQHHYTLLMSEYNATAFIASTDVLNAPATPGTAYLGSSSPLPFGYAVYRVSAL
jgi:hypothetical protein